MLVYSLHNLARWHRWYESWRSCSNPTVPCKVRAFLHVDSGSDAISYFALGALESVDLTLASYAALHSCTLRFALPEMCVAENTSLAWIPTIIGQLSSPSLRSLTISLVVDNVEDLRSLNSECAVRVLTTAYFNDMWVLDWAAIGHGLSSERLEGLRRVVVEGFGPCKLLEEHIRVTCPELHTRGILSLVAVAKAAPWAN